jgi:hypothetical protein
MQTLSPAIRLALGALAAGLATVMAPDVFGILPLWLQIVFGFVSAALAFMLLPINWIPTDDGNRAIKRGAPRRSSDAGDAVRKRRGGTGIAVLVVLMLAVAAGAFVPSPASATPPFSYGQARYAMCNQLKPYAVAWLTNNGYSPTLTYANSGPSYSHPAFNSFVRDNGSTWTVQCQWVASSYPYQNPFASAGAFNYGRVAATATVGGSLYQVSIGQASINLAGVDWFYLYWMDPNCPQCWKDVPGGVRLPG